MTNSQAMTGSIIGEVELGDRSIVRAIRLIELGEKELHLSVEFLLPVNETTHKAMAATMKVTREQLQELNNLCQKGLDHNVSTT